jgi:type II secretory pathway pseudopilin PulG
MKAASTGKFHRGVSIVEILIALAILTLTISAVIMLVFGNQSLTLDTQTNIEALAKAESQLEEQRALAEQDFFKVDDSGPVTDGTYQKEIEINNRAKCLKEAVSTVSWKQGGRNLDVSLTTLFFDLETALAMGGDCDPTKKGDWDDPTTAISLGIGGQGATDIEIFDGMVYLTSDASSPGKDDLYIFEYDAATPTLIPKSSVNLGKGLLGIEVIREQSTGDLYAYVLEADNANQLRVVNVTNPASPSPGVSLTIPSLVYTCTPPQPSDCLAGRSLHQYDKKLYVGLQYMIDGALPPEANNELHMYDVSNPATPVWIGSANPNANVNDIEIYGDYAYLATSGDAREVMVYDISVPATPDPMPVYDASGDEDGTTVFLIGTQLLLGRENVNSGEEDFIILDAQSPSTGLTRAGGLDLGLHNNGAVQGIVARDDLVFIALDDSTTGFRILNIKNPLLITDHTTCSTLNYSENTTAMDMGGDEVFTANASNDEIRVLRDQTSACAP